MNFIYEIELARQNPTGPSVRKCSVIATTAEQAIAKAKKSAPESSAALSAWRCVSLTERESLVVA